MRITDNLESTDNISYAWSIIIIIIIFIDNIIIM